MTPDQLRALADALEPLASLERSGSQGALALESTIDYLRAQADAQPVRAVPIGHALSAVRHVGSANYPDRERAAIERLYSAEFDAYTRPAPAVPQAEPHRNQPLRDLLAVIHCDGGHHTEAVGIEQSIKDALSAVCVLKGKLAQAEPKREPLSDERIAEIQRAAYERAAQECIETAAELRRCADGCTDGRYDWKADGADDCADAIRALGSQQ